MSVQPTPTWTTVATTVNFPPYTSSWLSSFEAVGVYASGTSSWPSTAEFTTTNTGETLVYIETVPIQVVPATSKMASLTTLALSTKETSEVASETLSAKYNEVPGETHKNLPTVLAILVPSAVLLIIAILTSYCLRRRKLNKRKRDRAVELARRENPQPAIPNGPITLHELPDGSYRVVSPIGRLTHHELPDGSYRIASPTGPITNRELPGGSHQVASPNGPLMHLELPDGSYRVASPPPPRPARPASLSQSLLAAMDAATPVGPRIFVADNASQASNAATVETNDLAEDRRSDLALDDSPPAIPPRSAARLSRLGKLSISRAPQQ